VENAFRVVIQAWAVFWAWARFINKIMFRTLQSPTSAGSFTQDVKNISITERPSLCQAALDLRAKPQLSSKRTLCMIEACQKYFRHSSLLQTLSRKSSETLAETIAAIALAGRHTQKIVSNLFLCRTWICVMSLCDSAYAESSMCWRLTEEVN
jgi:hypothetical protein